MITITDEMVANAKTAYWHEVHNGGGYSDECYRAALTAALAVAPGESTPSDKMTVLGRLEEIAKAQKSYHDLKQHEFPCVEDFLDEDGLLKLPDDIGPLLQQCSYNGRYSEADWWISVIQKMKAENQSPQTRVEGEAP